MCLTLQMNRKVKLFYATVHDAYTPLPLPHPPPRAPPALTNHKLFLLLKKRAHLSSCLHLLQCIDWQICKQMTCFCKNQWADSALSEWWKWLLDLWWGFKLLLPALVDAATPISVSGKHKNISMAGQYWNQTNIVYTAAAELTSLKFWHILALEKWLEGVWVVTVLLH